MTVTYPSAEDYILAVQQPDSVFALPTLRSARFTLHPSWQVPMATSGSSAVVFRAAVDGSDRALRFFTHDSAERVRYTEIGRHVEARSLGTSIANATWRDDAIRVRGGTWPVIEMEWVEGRTLDAYVANLVDTGDRRTLGLLAAKWRELIARLQAAEFAHGDLQHGNVLVDTDGRLRLVDLDGSWIPALAGKAAPPESGHPNYQRRDREWGPWMDTFPGLVVYTALLGLAAIGDTDGERWIDDKIVFSERDLASPFGTETWSSLAAVPDAALQHALALLRGCCAPGWKATGSLEDLLDSDDVPAPRPVVLPGTKWWEQTAPETVVPTDLPPPVIPSVPEVMIPDPYPPRQKAVVASLPPWSPKTTSTQRPPITLPPPLPLEPETTHRVAYTLFLAVVFGMMTFVGVWLALVLLGSAQGPTTVAAALSGVIVALGVIAARR